MPDTTVNLYGPGILEDLQSILEPCFGQGPFIVITDGRIWEAVSRLFSAFLRRVPGTTIHILPAHPAPYASDSLVARIAAVIAATQAVPVAVGSGTVNDIVKRASFENGRRYVCVPTAPSVDGYTSMSAAITVGGFKSTIECPAPLCVVADENIILGAPQGLIASGYGDIIAKLTGGADWIIADTMGIEAIDPVAWDLAQSAAVDLLPRGKAIQRGDRDSVGTLYRGLVASGLAMQEYNDSRPASGTEHLMSHTWEMSHLAKDGEEISHGFKVAVGTLVAAALMEELFGEKGAAGAMVRQRHFDPCLNLLDSRMRLAGLIPPESPHRAKTISTIAAKTPGEAEIARRAEVAGRCWTTLSERVRRQVPPFAVLAQALRSAGCPVQPAQIGLSREECLRSARIASLIRARYTVLDLASELGALETAIESVFSGDYFQDYA